MNKFTLSGNIVDLIQRKIFPGVVTVENEVITSMRPTQNTISDQYILPGFIDAHVHIESSMLIPSEFARLAVPHGTVATISDPHEIGNVLGIRGVRYMIKNGSNVPFHFYFGAPSCVPATSFETSGAVISAHDIRDLFVHDKLKYLSEMMNYPGVLSRIPLVMEKIGVAQELHLPIDGHSPGLKGKDAEQYISAGISTDHECYTLEEALDKIKFGMNILIREGSAAKNYEALHTLIGSHPDKVMFSSDDKHPDALVQGHINELVRRSIVDHGYDVMNVLRAACFNPIQHYNLDVGLLQEGQSADFIVVDNLRDFSVLATYIKGNLVAKNGKTLIKRVQSEIINNFHTSYKKEADFRVEPKGDHIKVIKALNGQIFTEQMICTPRISGNNVISDPSRDILKIAVINRYESSSEDNTIAIGFIHGFGLKHGALASCIAHDSHNIIVIGVSDADICSAVNKIIENKGGICVATEESVDSLPLPIAGIMGSDDGYTIAEKYSLLDQKVKKLGSPLDAPFMTLSFMALLVIPSLKLSDKGLFDGSAHTFTPLFSK